MQDVLKSIHLSGVIPVVKFKSAADAVPTCKAIREGGLDVVEITFRTDAAEEAIQCACKEFPDMLIGAGTVTTIEQAQRAMRAGAKFIVAPGLNPRVVQWCIDHSMPIIPGVNDPSGIEAAMELGLNCVKFFPAEASGGVKFLNAVHAPYAKVTFVPTGGVNEDNLSDYLSAPGVTACGGSWMAPADAIERGDFDSVRELVRRLVRKMLNFRLAHVGVNTENEQAARAAAARLELLFGFTAKEGNSSVMAGQAVELVKGTGLGTHGHIAIGVSDAERAVYSLTRFGFAFDQTTAKTDAKGALKAIYLAEEIAGFAIHLVQC